MNIIVASPPLIPTPPPGKGYGGLERLAYDLVTELESRGHRVTLLAAPGSYRPGGGILYLPEDFESPANWQRHEKAVLEAADSFDAVIDMTHMKGVASILHGHTHGAGGYRCRTIRSYSFWTDAAGINPVFPSKHVKLLFSATPAGLLSCGAEDAPVIYPGIDLSDYRSAGKEDYFVYFGRIIPEKGVERAIHVARLAGVRLKVMGHVGQFSHDKQYIDTVRGMCTGGVEWVGEVDHKEKLEILSHARGMIFLPRWVESFGINVVEALASGCPCIVGNNGGPAEQIRSGVNGYVVGSIGEAVEAVKRVAEGEIDPETCVESSRRFSKSRMAGDWEALIKKSVEAG